MGKKSEKKGKEKEEKMGTCLKMVFVNGFIHYEEVPE